MIANKEELILGATVGVLLVIPIANGFYKMGYKSGYQTGAQHMAQIIKATTNWGVPVNKVI